MKAKNKNSQKRPDHFGNADFDHLKMNPAEELSQILALPETRWFASSAPIDAFSTNPRFLKYLNENQDRRLRPKEIKSAIKWFLRTFKEPDKEAIGSFRLHFAHLNQSSTEGKDVLFAAQRILRFLGKGKQDYVDLDDVQRMRKRLMPKGLEKLGRIKKGVKCSMKGRRLIEAILEMKAHQATSICEKDLDEFVNQGHRWDEWKAEMKLEKISASLPFGDEMSDCYSLYSGLIERIDAFFNLCQLAKVNPQIKAMVTNLQRHFADSADFGKYEDVQSLALRQPIAALNSDCVLKFNGPINPSDATQIRRFQERIFTPLFGENSQNMKFEQWQNVKSKFEFYENWMRRKPDGMDVEWHRKYQDLLSGKDELKGLFAQSHANAAQMEAVCLLEKAVLFQAHLPKLISNFVSCSDLYSPTKKALFEMGTLIIDGREINFCVRVSDRDRHIHRCQAENIFIIYAAISEVEGKVKYEIAAPLCAGLRGNLHEGQWGIFHDFEGRQHHAQVMKMIEKPISLWDGIKMHFRWIGEIARMTFLEFDDESNLKLRLESKLKLRSGSNLKKPLQDRYDLHETEFDHLHNHLHNDLSKRILIGTFAFATLGFSVAFIVKTLSEIEFFNLILVMIIIPLSLLLIMFLTTARRLQNRDLRCILEGAGWGINLPMPLTSSLANHLTRQRLGR